MDIQIVIMAGGRGQLLYPIASSHVPKMLLPVANKPLLAYVLEMIEQSGCTFSKSIIVATPEEYFPKMNKYLSSKYRSNLGNTVESVAVPEDYLGTAGTMDYLKTRLTSDTLILSADLIIESPVFVRFVESATFSDSDCSLLLHTGLVPDEEMEIFGLSEDRIVLLYNFIDNEEGFKVPKRILEKFPKLQLKNNLITSYCYFFRSKLLKLIFQNDLLQDMKNVKEDLIPYLIFHGNRLGSEIKVGWVHAGEGFCKRVQTIKNFMEVNMASLTPVAGSNARQPAKAIPRCLVPTINNPPNIVEDIYSTGRSNPVVKQVSAESKIKENFDLGEKANVTKSIIGKNVRIGKRCKITSSIIFDDVVIEDECTINNAIICSKANVGKKSKVLNSQLAYECMVPPDSFLKEEKLI